MALLLYTGISRVLPVNCAAFRVLCNFRSISLLQAPSPFGRAHRLPVVYVNSTDIIVYIGSALSSALSSACGMGLNMAAEVIMSASLWTAQVNIPWFLAGTGVGAPAGTVAGSAAFGDSRLLPLVSLR